MHSQRSKEDQVMRISKSLFVTNFLDYFGYRDFWKLCESYGKVIDVFIPNRLSKAGKWFAFVRFIRVTDMERLIGNLCTLWVDQFHLHANAVEYVRPSRPAIPVRNPLPKSSNISGSYVNVVKDIKKLISTSLPSNLPPYISSSPALVLDDSCVVSRKIDNYVMGEVKQFSSITHLRVLLSNKGFPNVKLAYLGGLWVMIALESIKSKANFMKHGVPLHIWSRATFHKIGAKWGEVMELEEGLDDCFGRKRICIKTKQEENILERFKIIVHGKIFVVRSKELFVWTPIFNEVKDAMYCTDDESVKGGEEKNGGSSKHVNSDDESDVEEVSDTYFGDSDAKPGNEHNQVHTSNDKETSPDPFNIYNLLKKQDVGLVNSGADTNIPFPPGFTPEGNNNSFDKQEANGTTSIKSQRRFDGFCSCVVENAQDVDDCQSSDTEALRRKIKKGGSLLEVLDDMINVSHTMGYTIEGCVKDMEKIIGLQGGHDIYAPQAITDKRELWNYFSSLIARWDGDCIVMWDFNEVKYVEERMGSVFYEQGESEFNNFIYNSRLVDVHLEGYSFTWSHPSASKIIKLDRFLVTEGVVSLFPHISAICLDRHLSDHRPILLRDAISDYGAIPFRFYHSWLRLDGFDQMVTSTWSSITLDDRNGMVRFKKKLQILKKEIRTWVADYKRRQSRRLTEIKSKLHDIDVLLDQGGAIEGDENSKFFHGIINRKRANLSIKRIMVDGEWVDDPIRVKEEFRTHFATRFQAPDANRCRLDFRSPNRLSLEQASDLESLVTNEEIRSAVWGCGEDKSHGPDGFTFDFFRKFWSIIGPDFCLAVEWFVSDYRPISLIGSLYKVVTKVLATRLSLVISDLISDVQTTFLPNRQILDGPFIINELLSWCNHYEEQTMLFKVDFAKAYDSVRWDYLDDVLRFFGFGSKWCSWISGSLISGMASILVNGSPTFEFQFHCGLKQGDPLAPYIFILIMESLYLSFSRVVDEGLFKGIQIGVGVPREIVNNAATNLGCSVMTTPFKYLGVMVGGNMSLVKAWDEVIEYGGLGVSIFYALNRALLFKWEVQSLKSQGVDLLSHCQIRVGNGFRSRFWKDKWIGDNNLCHLFPRAYALETNKDCSVAEKLNGSKIDGCELNSDGVFHVKDIRRFLDEFFLPKVDVATRWINSPEDISHLLFKCSLAVDVSHLICRWWDLSWSPLVLYSEWLDWFKSIRLNSKSKDVLEGVFYVSWWSIWNYRNQLLFVDQSPRKDVVFDDIVTRSFMWCQSRCSSSFSW
nr:RNA-directed DNA polymerase, eukaryota [Tanacetum cinerariifolium]